MKYFGAFLQIDGPWIISVEANSAVEAEKEIIKKLDRHELRGRLAKWKKNGKIIRELKPLAPKHFTAVLFQDGPRIITVQAEDKAGAVQAVTEQLDRPGRRGILEDWTKAGKNVQELED